MTEWLRDSYLSLEDRVAERTQDLERQNIQIQVAAEIARDVTTSRDLNELLNRSVELISQRFGFYHAGIFLLDNANEYAELHAASGPTSQDMLSAHHKLKVGETGIVGYVAASGKPRIALDVGADAVHFQNPLLPETRSEIALPLRVGDAVIGVLDVQSLDPSAFNEEAINVLQILADLIAVAIQNTRLYQELQDNLDELETLYGENLQLSWRKIVQSGSLVGYQYDRTGVHPLKPNEYFPNEPDDHMLNVPLVIRGQEIGTIIVHSADTMFPDEDRAMLEDLGTRISQSLDSARLFTEAQRRAENEKLINQATSRMLETLDIETVLKSAAEDIYQVLDLANITIDLTTREIG
jgi:GAF domain-containing protein